MLSAQKQLASATGLATLHGEAGERLAPSHRYRSPTSRHLLQPRCRGEWSVALRCAQWSSEGTLTAYAGAGIVADSDPESELLETRLKFKPIVQAFGQDDD